MQGECEILIPLYLYLYLTGYSVEICNMHGECEIAHRTLPDEWSNVEVSQHPEGDKYRYEVKVNGVLIGSILNEDAQMFEDVRIYGSDPTQTTSQGTMRNMNVAPNYEGTRLGSTHIRPGMEITRALNSC